MLIGIGTSAILGIVFLVISANSYEHEEVFGVLGVILLIIACALVITGLFTGFINYPATEGTHVGVITAVDLEGVWFRRYEVYLKSSGYTNQSDETKYLILDKNV